MKEITDFVRNCGFEDNPDMIRLVELFDELITFGVMEKCDNGKYNLTRNGHATFGLMLLIDEFGIISKKSSVTMSKELVEKGFIKIVNENEYFITEKGLGNVVFNLIKDRTNEEAREYVKMKLEMVERYIKV